MLQCARAEDPVVEYAILFVDPIPTATNLVPFHATPNPADVNILVLSPVQLVPVDHEIVHRIIDCYFILQT